MMDCFSLLFQVSREPGTSTEQQQNNESLRSQQDISAQYPHIMDAASGTYQQSQLYREAERPNERAIEPGNQKKKKKKKKPPPNLIPKAGQEKKKNGGEGGGKDSTLHNFFTHIHTHLGYNSAVARAKYT